MMSLSKMILTLQKFSWRPTTTMTITMHSILCQHQLHSPQLLRNEIHHLKKWTWHHASSNAHQPPIMNLRNILSFLKKISILAILSPGGLVTVLNFPISPNLSQFAHDILGIPDIYSCLHIKNLYSMLFSCSSESTVAVKQIFSCGHDTISLHRACLEPDTIHTLMVVKQHLQLAQNAIMDAIGG